jgi:DNA polymerase III subunit delta'
MLFSDIEGQHHLKQQLIQAAVLQRVPQAMLLHGLDGYGGLALSRAFTQFLLCENPAPTDACGKCPQCIQAANFSHPDVHHAFPIVTKKNLEKPHSYDFIDQYKQTMLANPFCSLQQWYDQLSAENKQGFIPVKEAATIISRLVQKKVVGRYTVINVWHAELMRDDTANKLLKVLEEPPINTVFIFHSQYPNQLLTTIRSRMQAIKIPPFGEQELANQLVKYGVPAPQANTLSKIADGDLIKALALHQKNTSQNWESRYLDWLRACKKKDLQKIIAFTESISNLTREEQKTFTHFGLDITRQAIAFNYGNKELIKITDEVFALYQNFFPFVNVNNASAIEDELNKAYYHLERNANTKILFADLSFKMAALI